MYVIAQLGIGVEKINAGIGIPASIVSVLYSTKKKCQTVPLLSGTGLVPAS
jgi:hypothetical protein